MDRAPKFETKNLLLNVTTLIHRSLLKRWSGGKKNKRKLQKMLCVEMNACSVACYAHPPTKCAMHGIPFNIYDNILLTPDVIYE